MDINNQVLLNNILNTRINELKKKIPTEIYGTVSKIFYLEKYYSHLNKISDVKFTEIYFKNITDAFLDD